MTDDKYFYIEREREDASGVYLMSLMVAMAGLPLPIINLFAMLIYFASTIKKATYFVKFHLYQALISQVFIAVFNSFAAGFIIDIIFFDGTLTNLKLSYIITVGLLNLVELIGNVIAAVQVRKGVFYKFFFFGEFVQLLIGKNE